MSPLDNSALDNLVFTIIRSNMEGTNRRLAIFTSIIRTDHFTIRSRQRHLRRYKNEGFRAISCALLSLMHLRVANMTDYLRSRRYE
jgi:hypothetical protein